MNLCEQYQTHVLGPTEIIDWSGLVSTAYPPAAISTEPFVGFKVLCRDTAGAINPAERLRQIDANLGFLRGKGCVIRETAARMPDGFWIMTMPVPRSQMQQSLRNMYEVLGIFQNYFGIVPQGLTEINVSGRCHYSMVERCLAGVVIPTRYQSKLVVPDSTPYKLGHVIRINDGFMVFRSRWNITSFEDICELAQLLTTMYH